jgi:hypothetical protein
MTEMMLTTLACQGYLWRSLEDRAASKTQLWNLREPF